MAITAERLQVEISSSGAGEVTGAFASVKQAALNLRKAVGVMGAGVAAASGILAGVGVNAARKFQDAMVEVEKVTSAETAAKMSEEVKRMANTIPLAQSQLADLVAQAGRFGVAEDEMVGFTQTVAKMSTATDLAASEAGEAFAKLATITDTPISKMENLGSTINGLSNNFATSSSEIVTSMMESASSMSNLGASQVEIAGLSAALNEVTNNASKAGRGLRRVAQEMLDPRKVSDLARGLGVSVDEFKRMRSNAPVKTIKRLASTMQSGGKQADTLRKTFTSFSRVALSNLAKNLDGVNSAIELSGQQFEKATSLQREFEAQSKTFNNQLQLLQNQLRNIAIEIGEALLPPLTDFIQRISTVVGGISDWVSSLSDAQIRIGLLSSQVGGLLTAFTALRPYLPIISSGLAGIAAPAAVLIGTIGTLAAVFSGKFPEAASAAGDAIWSIRQRLIEAGEWIATTGVKRFKTAIRTLASRALEAFTFTREKILPAVRTALSGTWQWVRTKGVALATQALNTLVRQATAAFTFTREEILPTVKTALSGAWTWVRTEGVTLAKTALSFLGQQAINAFSFTKAEILPPVRRAVNGAWTWVRTEGVSAAKQALVFLGQQALNAFSFTKSEILPKVRTAIRGAWNWVRTEGVTIAKGALTFLGNAAVEAFKFGKKHLQPRIREGINAVNTWLRENGVSTLKAAVAFLSTQAVNAFEFTKQNIVPKVRTALTGAGQWLRNNGVPILKSGLQKLVTLSMVGFATLHDEIIPAIRGAINDGVDWLLSDGLKLFKAAFRGIGRNIGPALLAIQDAVLTTFREGIPMVREWLRNNGTDVIKQGFKAIGTGIRLTILKMLAIPGIVGQALVSTINGMREWLRNGGKEKLKQGFIDIATGIADYLKNDAIGDLVGAVQFIVDGIIAVIEGLYEGLIGNSLFPEMIRDIASYLRDTGKSLVTSAFRTITDAVTSFLTGEWIPGTIDAFKGMIQDTVDWLGSTGESIMSSAFDGLAQAAVDAYNAVMPDQISIPSVTIPRVSIDIPKISVAGQTIYGGGSYGVGPFGPIGGQSWDIPQLAEGGVVTGLTSALLGEGGDDEAVIPLNSRGMGRLTSALERANVSTGSSGSGGLTIRKVIVNANGEREGRRAARGFTDELRADNFDQG
ncbi:phage tail tape measure protein [Halomarina salina]|uniref:Phage tail tape measure protein n=1 Tax=Halomarina salina TaxID=1872699 RepID=A0ABD5RHN0_9EURY|nr:phage tail tape measure protein [Halomarina salina]